MDPAALKHVNMSAANITLSTLSNKALDELIQKKLWGQLLEKQASEPAILATVFRELLWVWANQQDKNVETGVTEETLESFLEFCPSVASQCFDNGTTPLHDAIEAGAGMPIVKRLVSASPGCVTMLDSEYQSPLDILCRKIIMSEERQKYNQRDVEDSHDENYENLWECARLLLVAIAKQPDDEPLLHALLYAGYRCPESLRTRAWDKFAHQLVAIDGRGDMPIHISAGILPNSDEEEADDLPEIVHKAPISVMERNANDQTALEIAVSVGRLWNTGIHTLLKAQPCCLASLALDLPIYSFVFRKCASDLDLLFDILRNHPTIFMS
jgi:hypothetical protein